MFLVSCINNGIKKYFLLSSIMAENKRIDKIFFSKCVAASKARIELNAVALWITWLSVLIFWIKKSKNIKKPSRYINLHAFFSMNMLSRRFKRFLLKLNIF